MKVFWSWQNDYSPNSNRHFIRDALKQAVDGVSEELGLEDADRAELDHDTKNEAGMADIVATIFRKISEAAVFVADVTPIGVSNSSGDGEDKNLKPLPNPNVMIELGWALSATGYERLIPIFNLASGFKPDDLPFDIRHRRVLTYTLADDASSKDRASAKRDLIRTLTAALKSNLGQALEEIPSDTIIAKIPSAPDNPSIWADCKGGLVFQGGLAGNDEEIEISDRPRAYLRYVPRSWKSGPPPVAHHQSLPRQQDVWPASDSGMSGSFGFCEEGFVRVWYAGKSAENKNIVNNLSMWFDENGEYWILHGEALVQQHGQTYFRLNSVLQNWRSQIQTMTRFFDAFGAENVRELELGVVGLRGALLASNSLRLGPRARKPTIVYKAISKAWTDDDIDEILFGFFNIARDAFGLAHAEKSEFTSAMQ
ncbi:MAG: hypothetical protein RKE49_00790 [Oceanicaulis sp.]